jgi:hypothetical protein
MKTFAVIENNKVINVILADLKEIAEEVTGQLCIEYTEEDPVGIGWDYDGVSFVGPVVEQTGETEESFTQ